MAEDDVATKAPESDAQEPSVISSEDTSAQKGASMGEHCVTDRPTPAGGEEPTGEISKIADVEVYITKPSDYPHLPSKLLLFLSSGTGIHSKNNQLQADKYAAEGFLVVMPDQFAGDPSPKNVTDPTEDSNPSMIEKVKVGFATTAKSFMLDMWLARQTPEKVLPILQKVVEGAREEFADAVANGGGIYAVGYCFGGKYVCLLGSELPDTAAHGQAAAKDEEQGMVTAKPLIKAGAFAHGTMITKEDIERVKAPISIVAVENDQLFPDEVRDQGKKFLEENKIEHEMRVYEGVPHGFGVVGEYEDGRIRKKQEEAFEQMLGWLKAH
ncbi:hypothetical protein ACLMJK_008164 [Lecanora helva]